MTLRVRLLVGYGYLVALLLAAAGSAMLGFFQLSEGIDEVLDENFATIRASMEMVEALERQDSATLAALVESQPPAELPALETAFHNALEVARGNVTEEEEPAILEAIDVGFAAYREAREKLLSSRPERPLAAYDGEVFPKFTRVKADVVQLLDVNQRAMLRADREAKQSAVQNGAWLGFLVTLALLSFVFLSRALQRDVLSRLENLRRGLAMVMAGDLQRRLAEDGSDELTGIARHFNALLDYYQKIEARGRGRLAMERRLVLALLAICGEGAVLYDLKGDRLAGGKAAGGKPDPLREWITGPGREAIERSTAGDAPSVAERVESGGGEAVEATLLTTGEQPVAWLVRPAAPG